MASMNKHIVSENDIEVGNDYEKERLLNNDDSDQEEDTLFNKPTNTSEPVQVHGKLDSIKIQIREVTQVMRENVEKVMDRGDRLEDLQLASDRLNTAGTEFRNSARKARQNAWLKNLLAKFGTAAVALAVILTIIVVGIVKYS